MTVVDWRAAPEADVAACYAVERATWTRRFSWDTTDNWRHVEAARAAGTLPGFLVFDVSDETTPAGWGFHLLHRGTLQIGGIAAASPDAVTALLDRMLASPEAARARDAMAFIPETETPARAALLARGFAVRTFRYLARPLDTTWPESVTQGTGAGLSFHAGRLMATADLLRRAYPGADRARPFAPHGTADEWLDYTSQLIAQTGCGELLPWASVVDEEAGPSRRLIGAVLATRIAQGSAHLAQVAVDPAWQGRGCGVRLVSASLGRLQRRGYATVSLLVADDNAAALRLYTRLGFAPQGAFLSAWRSLAPAAPAS